MIEYHVQPFELREFKVEVTHRCNLNCIHCSSDAHPGNTLEMLPDECLRIVQEAADLGALDVAFSGGEPMIWSGITDAVQRAADLGLKVTIYTSGNADKFKKLAQRLYDNGALRFIFSIFGSDSAIHERVTRVAGSFSKTLSAIRFCARIGAAVEIHFVPLASNYNQLPGIAELGKKLGASRISVLRFIPHGRGVFQPWNVLSKVQNLQLKKIIEDLRHKGHDIRTGSPYNFLMLNENPACLSGIDRFIIRPDKRICPCDAFKQISAEDIVGSAEKSILNGNSVADCWNHSPYFQAIREYLTTPFAETCAECAAIEKCLSGCLAQKVIAYRTLAKKPDPDCILQ